MFLFLCVDLALVLQSLFKSFSLLSRLIMLLYYPSLKLQKNKQTIIITLQYDKLGNPNWGLVLAPSLYFQPISESLNQHFNFSLASTELVYTLQVLSRPSRSYRKLLFTVSGTLTWPSTLVRCSLTSLSKSQDTREWQKKSQLRYWENATNLAYCKKLFFFDYFYLALATVVCSQQLDCLTSDSSAKTSNIKWWVENIKFDVITSSVASLIWPTWCLLLGNFETFFVHEQSCVTGEEKLGIAWGEDQKGKIKNAKHHYISINIQSVTFFVHEQSCVTGEEKLGIAWGEGQKGKIKNAKHHYISINIQSWFSDVVSRFGGHNLGCDVSCNSSHV